MDAILSIVDLAQNMIPSELGRGDGTQIANVSKDEG